MSRFAWLCSLWLLVSSCGSAVTETGTTNTGGGTTSTSTGGTATSTGGTAGAAGTGASSTSEQGACTPGEVMPCYSGPIGTAGVGECKYGEATCLEDGSQFGSCEGEVVPQPDLCVTVADEDCNGALMPCVETWSKIVNLPGAEDFLTDLAVDSAGNVIAMMSLGAPFDFGGGPIAALALVKFDAQGNHVWSKGIDVNGGHIAVDANDDVLITGGFSGTLDLGGGTFLSAVGGADVFVAKLDAAGQHVWSRRFGGGGGESARTIAVDADGNVIVAGVIDAAADFGGGQLPVAGLSDFFVMKLDPDGNHVWSQSYGNSDDQEDIYIAASASNDIALTGMLRGTVDFGGGPLAGNQDWDFFLVKLDPNGAHLWSKRFGDSAPQAAVSVVFDSAENIILGGYFQGTVDFGGGPITAIADDGFVVKYGPAGALQWVKQVGGMSPQLMVDVAVGAGDSVVATGIFYETTDFGLGPVTSAGDLDMLVGRLAADGTTLWQKRFGDAGFQFAGWLAVDPADAVLLGGMTIDGAVDFGDGPLLCPGFDGDVVLAKLPP